MARIPSAANLAALLPCPVCIFYPTYLSYPTAQHGSAPRRDTALPSPRHPVPKRQQLWLKSPGQELALTCMTAKSLNWEAAFSLPRSSSLQSAARGCSLSCWNHASSSSQMGLLYWCFDRHGVRPSKTLNARSMSACTCNFNNAVLNSALVGKPDSPGFLLAHNCRGNTAGCQLIAAVVTSWY